MYRVEQDLGSGPGRTQQDLGSGPSRTWQDLVDLVEYGRMQQIAVDCRQIAVRLPSRGRSLIAESVEIGGRMQGITGVSRDIRRRNIPIERPPFYYLKELVLYSFNTRITILFLIYIYDRLNFYKEGTVKRYIRSLISKQFLQYIKDIHTAGFSSKVSREANRLVPPQPSTRKSPQIMD